MRITNKFRIYPGKRQAERLEFTLDKCRLVYNKLLEKLQKEKEIPKFQLQHYIIELRKEHPELGEVYARVLQYEHYKLFSNLTALSRLKKNGRKIGRLRFKGKDWFKTFTYNLAGFALVKKGRKTGKISLSKIGVIPLKAHREISGRIKQVTVKKSAAGKWYVLVITEEKEFKPQMREPVKKVGVDLGIKHFAFDSEGNSFEHPRNLTKNSAKTAKLQRRLRRHMKGSNNWLKARIKLAKQYEKTLNQRNDFLHKVSTYYVRNYGLIAVEKLDIKALVMNSHNARNIADSAWSRFSSLLEYKAERAGVRVVKVDPKGTTQVCSNCGRTGHKELWNRVHECECGLKIDRDFNSAREILKRALRQELPEFTPAETEPLPARASLVEEAGNSNKSSSR